ncbi:MAG: glycosyltransferase [Chloroflexota bacterium]
MLSTRPTVSVVIPTLNEAHNLPLVLPYLPLNWIDEVILVDGRSDDETVEIARRLLPSIKVVLEKNPGKGMALQAGFAAAGGDIIVTLDADGSHDPREIPRMVEALLEGADFVKGSRFTAGGGTTDMPLLRKAGNWALGTVANVLFNGMYTDLCYGYHAFWRYCLETIHRAQVSGFEIDTAIYVRLLREHLRVVEVPSFEGYRFYGVGKLQTFPDGWRVLKTILHEWVDSWKSRPDNVFLGFRGYCPAEKVNLALEAAALKGLSASDEIALIRAIGDELNTQPNREARLQRLLEITMHSFGATSGCVIVADNEAEVAEGTLSYAGRKLPYTREQLTEILRSGLAAWVMENRRAALISRTTGDPRWVRRPWEDSNQSVRSAICVPLSTRERAYGVLTLVKSQAEKFTQDDLTLLTAIAACASAFTLNKSMNEQAVGN